MDALELTFDPMTIEHLGSNMYSRLPNAVAELVANAYDADAQRITVRVRGTGETQTIAVEDDGHGMSREDLRSKYLRIGRNRRDDQGDRSESGTRHVSGKKGLGKLALFGIGTLVEVRTKRAGATEGHEVALDWDVLRTTHGHTYHPSERTFADEATSHGTTVTISRLERKTAIDAKELASSLARLFNYADSEVSVTVVGRHDEEYPVDVKTRLASIDQEFVWDVPESDMGDSETLRQHGVTGRIVAAVKPLPTQVRGITVYANGRMVNEPEFFGAADSSYAYAYMTGYVEIDELDDLRPDVIATDRRAVNWETPQSAPICKALRSMVDAIARDRRGRREKAKREIVQKRTDVDIEEWTGSIKNQAAAKGVEEIFEVLASEEADLSDAMTRRAVNALSEVAPPYAELFWAQLEPSLKAACEVYYRNGLYVQAVTEAIKNYVSVTRRLMPECADEEDRRMLYAAYGRGKALTVLSSFDTEGMTEPSRTAIEDGHRDLSGGVLSAFRNPPSHMTHVEIERRGLMTARDCLDALAIVSHLTRRAEAATRVDESAQG